MFNSFEEFKTAVHTALRDKVTERLNSERENISNSLLRGELADSEDGELESNTDEN
jgi:hypothetical protein